MKNVLMELRKCCNHPYLFEDAEADNLARSKDKDPLRAMIEASGKLELVDKMVGSLLRYKQCP